MSKVRDQQYLAISSQISFSLLVIVAIALSLIESQIPVYLFLPGLKLGISNIVILTLFPFFGFRKLLSFTLIKICVTSFLLGAFSIFLFSLAGGLLSFFAMYFTQRCFPKTITIYSLAIIGAVMHNIGQTLFAIWYLDAVQLVYYIPFLMMTSCLTGLLTGYLADSLKGNIERNLQHD